MSNNNALLNAIKKHLRAAEIEVAVQKAVTTDSIYVRLDRGVLGSLRIGNHTGRAYQYTYEIGKHIREYAEIPRDYMGSDFLQYKFPEKCVKELAQQIIIERANMRAKYSHDVYVSLVKKSVR